MRHSISLFIKNNEGVTAIEYAVVAVGVATVVGAIFLEPTFVNAISAAFSTISVLIIAM